MKQKYVPSLCDAVILGYFATTEANIVSDMASMKTRAIWDGEKYIFNGKKCGF